MRATWKEHPNLAGGPAAMLLSIHDQFRAAAERLLLLVEREDDLGWVARAFAPLSQTLHHHHHAEEVMLFPMIHRKTGSPPSNLVDDHGELTKAIAAVEQTLVRGGDPDAARAAARAFREVLVTHLDREETLVVPVLLELTPEDAWAQVHGA